MTKKLYTKKIDSCLVCGHCNTWREKGKRYSTTKCGLTRNYIATGNKEDIPTRDQELNLWKLPPFPSFCPLEDCE